MSEEEGQRFKDLWAWADEEDDDQGPRRVDPDLVTAVVVVRDAEAWLADQLEALRRLNPGPAWIIAVDAGSQDASAEMLAAALADGTLDDVLTLERDTTFADAVAAAVAKREPGWLWILHDDSFPDPDALGELLDVAEHADVLFPKLLAPRRRNYPDVIDEVGQSITRYGQRVDAPEVGEVDQYQVEPGAILGGSTAGMMVRGETWRSLGGLAPELMGHRDGVDFGWRANVAGWHVVTAPNSTLVHLHAGMNQERPRDEHPHFYDRLAALRVVSARGTNGARLALGSLGRSIGFLLAKSPRRAGAELRAQMKHLRTGSATRALAERLPEGDPTEVDDLLGPRYYTVRTAFDRVGSALMDRFRDLTSEPDTSLDDLTSDEYSSHGGNRRRAVSPGLVLAMVFLVAGVAAGWRLAGGAWTVAGGGLLPAPDGVTAAWNAYLGDGMPALGIGAVIGTLTFGNPQLANFLLVLLSPMVAALTAYSLTRRVGCRPWLGATAAGLWAAAVLVMGLPAAGDVSGLVVAMVGPLLARSWYELATDTSTGAEALRAPAFGAFWLFVVGAFWPLALVLFTVAAIAIAAWRRERILYWALAIGLAWLAFVPWLGRLFTDPMRWLTGVDPLAWPDFPPSGYALFVGRILPSGVPVWLSVGFFGALGLLAVWGLLRIPQEMRRWIVAATIGLGLLAGAGLSRIAVSLEGGQTRAMLTGFALLVVAGMIAAVVLAERPRDTEHSSRTVVVLTALVALVAAVAWPIVGFLGPVQTGEAKLPGYVSDVVHSPRASRALLIDKTSETLQWNVVDAERPRWGSGEQYPAGAFEGDFEELVQAFSGGNVPEDLAERLGRLAVSHVWLQGFSPDELLSVGNAAGLAQSQASDTASLFTVVGLVSRANIVDGGTSTPVVDGVIPEGGEGRRLTISEPSGQLEVRVGGQELTLSSDQGDVPTFELGDASGALVYGPPKHWFALWWSVGVLTIVALLAAPTAAPPPGLRARRRGQDEEVQA